MDILFMNSSVYEIPSSSRVGAIIHDGAADMRLSRGQGPDRALAEAWHGDLQGALNTERDKLGVLALELGTVARVHKGRLHCDFLLWVATRPTETRAERQPAPNASALSEAVMTALAFVAQRSFKRVALPALGDGPGAMNAAERLATIVRAAHGYAERCFAEGRAAVIEEVILCEPDPRVLFAAKRMVPQLARTAPAVIAKGAPKKAPAKPRSSRSRKKEPPKPALTTSEIGTARATATAYDTRRTYVSGDHFIHPKFGVGRVFNVTQENAIEVTFEDQSVRRMVHARS